MAGVGENFDVYFHPDSFFDDIEDDDTLSSESMDDYGTANWPLHADCKFDHSPEKGLWVLTPRSLHSLAALVLIQDGQLVSVDPQEIPSSLYPAIFVEACRLNAAKTVSHLVATWPYPVMDLAVLDIPLESYRGFYTKTVSGSPSLVDMIVAGLLKLRQCSRLRRLILPEIEGEGASLTKAFLQLPLASLQGVSVQEKVTWLRQQCRHRGKAKGNKIFGAEDCVRNTSLPEFDKDSFHRDASSPVTISLPCVVQWVGRNSNYWDVLVGLTMQGHSPFKYHIEKIRICNLENLYVVRDILKLIQMPERVRKLVFHTSRLKNTIHVYCQLGALAGVLQQFTSIESVISKLEGMYVHAFPQYDSKWLVATISTLFQHWKNLTELDLAGNILLGKIGKMLWTLDCPLRKLNLAACELSKYDLKMISESHHSQSLIYLNLDHNNLHQKQEVVRQLFHNLKSIVTLRTCNCQLTHQDACDMAVALLHSQTLKTWNLLQNDLGTFFELQRFVSHCSRVPGLKEVGCKPIEIHALYGGLYVHSSGPPPLSESEQYEIARLASQLDLLVF